MHYTTLTILPILALGALTSAAPLPVEVYSSSIAPPIRTPNTDAAALPILPKRSDDMELEEAWPGDFAKEKRSIDSILHDIKDGDFFII